MKLLQLFFVIACTIFVAAMAEPVNYSAKNVVNSGSISQEKPKSGGNAVIDNVANTGIIKQKGKEGKKNNVIQNVVNHDVIDQ